MLSLLLDVGPWVGLVALFGLHCRLAERLRAAELRQDRERAMTLELEDTAIQLIADVEDNLVRCYAEARTARRESRDLRARLGFAPRPTAFAPPPAFPPEFVFTLSGRDQ